MEWQVLTDAAQLVTREVCLPSAHSRFCDCDHLLTGSDGHGVDQAFSDLIFFYFSEKKNISPPHLCFVHILLFTIFKCSPN
jgi:hypothetical protein